MRHKKIGRHLNMSKSHYKSMFRNMCNSLIKEEIIKTTITKAKELRRIIEPLINLSKTNNLHNIRMIFNKLRDKTIVFKLINKIGPIYEKRKGGYTRIIKYKKREGDNSNLAYIELVDRKLIN